MFWGVGRQSRIFNTKLSGVFRGQSLPPVKFDRLGTRDTANGSSTEKAIQNIETNVPARGAPRDEAAIDVVPQRQACAATEGFKLPPDIAVLKHRGNFGSRHRCWLQLARSRP